MLPPDRQFSEQTSSTRSHVYPDVRYPESSPTTEGVGTRSIQQDGLVSQQPALQVFGAASSVNIAFFSGTLAEDTPTTRTATVFPSHPASFSASATTAQHADSWLPTTESDINTATGMPGRFTRAQRLRVHLDWTELAAGAVPDQQLDHGE